MTDKYITDDTLRCLPRGLFMVLLIWGVLIGQLTWQAKQLKSINVELINLPSQAGQIIVPKPPLRHATRQQSTTEQQPSTQPPSRTRALVISAPAALLSATNLPSDNKPTMDSVRTGQPGFEKQAMASVKTSEVPTTTPQFGAAYLNNPKPDYPAFARRMRMEGIVMLKVLVGRQGTPLKVEVAHSSGHEILDNAAAGSVRNWRFVPARQGDSPLEEWVQVPVAFSLGK